MTVEAELVADLKRRADIGAQLFFAVYHLSKDQVLPLFKDASPGFMRAYHRAHGEFLGEAPRDPD